MRIAVVDGDTLVLQNSVNMIRQMRPGDEVYAFGDGMELLEFIVEKPCEVLFLDTDINGMSGIMLAQEIKELMPNINIIFLTSYDEYYREAMELHASGYILKPLRTEDVIKEMGDLRYEVKAQENTLLDVSCFGNFEVKTKQGEMLVFRRSKARELFAYLIHKKGVETTLREAAAVLFEDAPFDAKQQNYMQKIISSMMHTLREHHVETVIKKEFNSMAVDVGKINCDYYRWMSLHMELDFSMQESYMAQYAWADFS